MMLEQLNSLNGKDILRDFFKNETSKKLDRQFMSFRTLELEGLIKDFDNTPNYFILDEKGNYIYDLKAKHIVYPLCTIYLSIKNDCYSETIYKIIEWLQEKQPLIDNRINSKISIYNSSIGVCFTFENKDDLSEFLCFINSSIVNSLSTPNMFLPVIDNVGYAPDEDYIECVIDLIVKYIREIGVNDLKTLTTFIESSSIKDEYKDILISKVSNVSDSEIVNKIFGKSKVKSI